MSSDASIRREAVDWLIRLRDARADDWEAFEQWMARDPAHAAAYWEIAAADADVAEALVQPRPAEVIAFPEPRRRRWFAGASAALAASIALVVGGYWLTRPSAAPYSVATQAGAMRTLALTDGTHITLNGDTRLTLDRNDARSVRLDRGEARFRVTHDARRPFTLAVGDATVRDLGTVFDVVRDAAGLRVAVAEGAVRYAGGGVVHDLHPGDTLERAPDGSVRIGRAEPADISGWAAGRLAYDRAPFERVAADLSRATGLAVALDPALAGRRFSGGFRLGKRDAATVARAARVMGVAARRDGKGWLLTASTADSR